MKMRKPSWEDLPYLISVITVKLQKSMQLTLVKK